jgi:hypothetical protein
MPRIPTVTAQIAARSGRSMAGIPSPTASPDAFGAPQAKALQMIGAGVQSVAAGVATREDKKRDEDVANRVAQSDFTSRELGIRNEVGADGAGYQERVVEEYTAFVDEQAELIEDDKARQEYKRRMMGNLPNVSSRSATYEFGVAAEHSTNELNSSLVSLDNRIRLSPTDYDTLVQQGVDVINANSNIPAVKKAEAADNWSKKAAKTYFEGRLDAATTAEEVDDIILDLQEEEWATKLSGEGLDSLTSTAKSARTSISTKADADARAAVDFLEGRATDVTMLLPEEEIKAAQEAVAKSGNPVTQARMARIVRDQEILRQSRGLPPSEQRNLIEETKGNEGNVAGLPQVIVTSINEASTAYGVPPSYLAAMVGREYGNQLKPGADGEINYNVRNLAGASSATGVSQIVDGTMLSLGRNPSNVAVVKSVTGIDMSTMSDAELLALRGNPKVSVLLGAAYAAENANIIRRVTGREPSDGELYMAHFLGGGGVTTLLRAMQSDPNQSAAALLPDSANANKTEFYRPNGEALTVKQLYDRLGSRFTGGTSYVAFGDVQTREAVLAQTEKAIADDPMTFSQGVGNVVLSDISTPEGMAARGQEARSVADYYSIPTGDMKPFTNDEAASITKQIQEGNADEVLDALTRIQGLGGAMAEAGMKQVGEKNGTYGYAGGLALKTGQQDTASDVVRGQKRMDDNPDIVKSIGASDEEMNTAFVTATGPSLFDVAPAQRQAIFDAAKAHYVETVVARGGTTFDSDAFANSVDMVLGGRADDPAVGVVNGGKTTLPPGVSGEMIEEAFGVMEIEDWTALSDTRTPPRYADGTIADPRDLQDEATLRAVGGGKYKVALDDGTYLVTGQPGAPGRMEAFILVPTADKVQGVLKAKEARVQETDAATLAVRTEQQNAIAAAKADGIVTDEEDAALREKYGIMWTLDAEGNRVDE